MMKEKYRIKLRSGRVVGPFHANQVAELYLKGHVDGSEQCQSFPVGDWLTFESFPQLKSLLLKLASGELTLDQVMDEKTHTQALLSEVQKQKQVQTPEVGNKTNADFKEFKFGKEAQIKIDYEELEKKYSEKIEKEKTKVRPTPTPPPVEEAGIEKTIIAKRPTQAAEDYEKTRIVNPNPFKGVAVVEPKDDLSSASIRNQPAPEEDAEAEEEDQLDVAEKTEFFDVSKAIGSIRAESKIAEKEFNREIAQLEHDAEVALYGEEKFNENEEDQVNEEEIKPKKKGMKPIVALAFFAIFLVLLVPDEEAVVEIKPNYIRIEFPVAEEFIDNAKSEQAFQRGFTAYQKQNYMSYVEAAANFKESLSYRFRDNDALGYIILTYAKIMENTRDRLKSANTIFRLIQIGSSRALTDVNITLGTSLFYSKMNKHETAINLIENFLRVNPPTAEIYAIYLDILISAGRLDKIAKVIEQLEKLERKPMSAYLSLARYYELDQRYEKARETIRDGNKIYPDSVPLILREASLSLSLNEIENFKKLVARVKELGAESSPIYYAKYLEYEGMIKASEGDTIGAGALFQQALDINESNELRSKLSQLSAGGNKQVQNLILESKTIEKMNQAREEVRLRNWDRALTRAIEAADILPNYIPSQLLLVDIQSKRGYFELALVNLERLKQIYPVNDTINFYLIRTYIRAYRIEDAEREIAILSQTNFSSTPEYAMVLGEFYNRTNNINLSVRNYNEAIRRNPLEDENYFALARIYLNYKRFEEARDIITRAIELDPINIFYHSIYAQILYEMQSADVAIGYLRSILDKNPDNPKILADIAIYYFRTGKIAEFESYKKRIEALRLRDESFYEFLVESARLRGNDEEVVSYSKELIRVNPGDLVSRMTLGGYLMRLGRYNEAIQEYGRIVDRLQSYPRAHYSIAKAYLALNNTVKAVEHAQREIDGNPEIDAGYYIMGEALRVEALRTTRDFTESVKFLERAISINGKSTEALMALGWIRYGQNFLEASRELYLRALREDPSIPDIHKQLGFIYRNSGQGRLAAESFNTYLQLMPNAPDRNQIETIIRQTR